MQSSRQTVEAKKPEQAVSNLRIKSSELIIFTTQLSVMLESGVVLSDALEAIAQQTRPGITKLVIQDVADRIKSGDCFSSALAQYPRIFSAMYVSMVKASEASGNMARMLQILSGYLNADADTRKQVKGAMIYPFVMLMMAIAATGSLMFFVLPRFTKIYESRGAALPKLTQVLVTFSSLLGNMRFMTAAVTLAVCLGILFWIWKQTTSGRKTLDWILVHTPIFGTMFIDAVLTRSMRIMATMVNTGVSLLEALDVMKTSCDNYYFQSLWAAADSKIRDGYQLSDSIVLAPHSELVAPGIIQMLRAGEKSGQIGQVADKVSIFYEKKLANSIRTATSLIEPLMVMIMGVVIGTIAIALLLPVFRISTIIAQ
ncbi:MAG TPA: type II secretion system F family protein [Anaerohalosphaeraceae bacterium]|jgi:type IV pilus assembly protein PilC|nr:type II secretion system F family protein [Anaerohalosphaeraceae bacterium]HRT49257.1 type II secretion system F family protein [Anaerohalosphaeraceae bacterium]HRT85204.1 type II secretion system F family protein [Anaerohalosphaeraceae bacterium]